MATRKKTPTQKRNFLASHASKAAAAIKKSRKMTPTQKSALSKGIKRLVRKAK